MADHTPESDLGSIECFQNYTAPEVFVQGLAGIVDQQDVEAMIRAQKQMLQRFEKTNEMLSNCNALSMNRFKVASTELKKHTQLLVEMRKDLDTVFKHIRIIKGKLSSQYPQAFTAPKKTNSVDDEEDAANKSNSNKPKISRSAETVATVQENFSEKNDNTVTPVQESAKLEEEEEEEHTSETRRKTLKRSNSSSSDSNDGNSNNDSSPYTSDTG
ncbi:kxDL motif-containing protein CG10681 [Macrosteles quadrilineatus]|uniref:kxDL motif-containing protein CG10681 n=1 Tax=Macrosteles quadrilineatus TaxID=74068 RepID=UPI0023E16EB5|nr:kxDL motif-containing protein CG10681 [Macrosteles quadrilineatus]